jgi:8-oxo-dGTP pyrophosphatase MutT (NUDIX family)
MTAMDEEIKQWELISSEEALSEAWFKVRKDKVKLPSGKVVNDYFIWESPTIATVVPITKDGLFVLCQQYRHAVNKIMYQFPAGGVNKRETPDQAAHREMKEETGYETPDQLVKLGDSAAYPTKLSGWHHLYLAKDVEKTAEKLVDENEPTRVVLKTPQQLWKMIQDGEFQVADSLAAGLLALKYLGL